MNADPKKQEFLDRLKRDSFHRMTFPDFLCKSPDALYAEYGPAPHGANTYYMRQGLARARWRDGVLRVRAKRAAYYRGKSYINNRNRKRS